MTILNDRQIKELVASHDMISPFVDHQIREENGQRILSRGLSSFGYDISLANEFKAYSGSYSVYQDSDKWNLVVDPLDFDPEVLETFTDKGKGYVIMPPHGYFLGHSVEYMTMPDNVNAICLTKSTMARCGVFLNTTPIEAAWHGVITLEIANLTDRPVKLYVGQGICQLQFFIGEVPEVSYADRKGKYMGQVGITLPIG